MRGIRSRRCWIRSGNLVGSRAVATGRTSERSPRCVGSAPVAADGPSAIVPAPRLAPTEASRRWAALLQQIVEVDPLACPCGHGAMRLVACINQTSIIELILIPRRTRASREAHAGPRSPPSTRGPAAWAALPTGPLSPGPPTTRHACPRRSAARCSACSCAWRSMSPPVWTTHTVPKVVTDVPPALTAPEPDQMAPRRPPRGAGEVGDRAECSTRNRPTPVEVPIPSRRNASSCSSAHR
jgi:hypothetical protein